VNDRLSIFAMIPHYRRLLTSDGRAALTGLLVWSAISGVLEGLALLTLLAGASALATGQAAFGLSPGGWVSVLLVLAVLGFLLGYVIAETSYRSAMDVMRNVHKVVGDKLATLPLGWYSAVESGRYSRALTSGMMELGQALAHMTSKVVANSAQLLTLAVGLWLWQPTLGLAFTVAVPTYFVVVWLVSRLESRVAHWHNRYKDDLATRMVEFAGAQRALRSAGRSTQPPHLAATLATENSVARRALWAETGLVAVLGMISQTIVVALVLITGALAIDGAVAPLAAIAFIGVALRLSPVIIAIGESVVGMFVLSQVLGPIGEVLDADSMPEPAHSAAAPESSSVELDRVTFGYHEGHPVLRDVSFEVPPRTMTALVGPSGSGKTTVARLVSRFYDPWEGSVRIGGQLTRDLTLADLMRQVSLVFQGVYLFDDTLLANIRVGNPSASDEEVLAAAETAGVSEIVRRLPDGWATRVGEGGTRLSGGERQRVSVARALVKHAPIVIIDEATSALDAENEDHLARAFENLRSESTVLVIAHKLSTIEHADQIVVLDQDGTVAQRGTHLSLRGTPGIYQDFCARREQAQGWRLVATD
jgi:ATP-binding cassette subfamily B protein